MDFLKRFFYYGIGLFMGIIMVSFIFDKKAAEFCYLPNCRVLKNIRGKQLQQLEKYTTNAFSLDTIAIKEILTNGTVDFSKSNIDIDSCKQYKIDGDYKEKNYTLIILNCKKTMSIQKIIKN